MKTIITLTFLLFSYLGFSQTTREEVVERNKYGQKLSVITYSGTGNSEKIVKITRYKDNNNGLSYYSSELCSPISLKPIVVEYYGKYIEEITHLQDDATRGWKKGEIIEFHSYGIIKRESYNSDGVLKETWKIEEKSSNNGSWSDKYKLIP
jgi:hypothetical protein